MSSSAFQERAAASGLLVSSPTTPSSPFGKTDEGGGPHDFHALPIYRAYVHGLQSRDLPEGFIERLDVPRELHLLRETDNRRDRRAIAVYADEQKLGYLPREDNRALAKLIRRGLPVACRLIGVQREVPEHQRLSVEVLLLYPRHPASDPRIKRAEADRLEGLARVRDKPAERLRVSGDPLSGGHVWSGYYTEH